MTTYYRIVLSGYKYLTLDLGEPSAVLYYEHHNPDSGYAGIAIIAGGRYYSFGNKLTADSRCSCESIRKHFPYGTARVKQITKRQLNEELAEYLL